MTPTTLEVTEEQYHSGSSAICHCGTRNYFLVSLNEVTMQWLCAKCGEDNYHPMYEALRTRVSNFKAQLQQLQNKQLDLPIIVPNDDPQYNHQFARG